MVPHILIFLSTITYSTSKLQLESHLAERQLTMFTLKAYSIYCSDAKTTLIINYRQNGVCDRFLKNAGIFGYSMPFYTYILNKGVPFRGEYEGGKADLTILFLNAYNVGNIDKAWKEIEHVPLYQSFSKYVLVFSSKPPENTKWIETIFRFLWGKKILRVFITFWDQNVKVFTFNPFLQEFCKDISHVNDTMKKFYLEFELFDLHGYPLRVFLWDKEGYTYRTEEVINNQGGIEFVGYDGKLLTQIRNILNVTLDIHRESESQFMKMYKEKAMLNSSYSTDVTNRFLNEQNIDILFTATRAKGNSTIDSIFLHERDDFVILIPVGDKVPEYLYIFLLIQPYLLVLTLFHMLVISIALHLIRHAKRNNNESYLETNFDVYKIIVNVPLTRHNDNFQERIVLCTWIIFSILFSVVFNCTMVSSLVVPKYYPTLEKIGDLVKTNMTVYATEYEYSLVEAALTGSDVELLRKLEVSYDPNFMTSMYSYQNKSGFMMRFERAREFLKVTKKIGRTRYNIMNEHPVPNAQSYLMPRGHPYLEEIQWIVHKVHESGLWDEWRKTDYGRENITTAPDVGETVFDESYIDLKLIHLQSTFYLLLFSHFVAFLVFCVEYLSQKTNAFKKYDRIGLSHK